MKILERIFGKRKVEVSSLKLETSMEELLLQHGWKRYGPNSWIKKEWENDPKHWYHTERTASAFNIMLEEALTLVPYSLRWANRYSQTLDPDKHGRWARAMYLDDVLYAWINRLEVEGDIRYSSRLYFPTKFGDTPHDHNLHSDFESAKAWCENELASYFKKVKSYK